MIRRGGERRGEGRRGEGRRGEERRGEESKGVCCDYEAYDGMEGGRYGVVWCDMVCCGVGMGMGFILSRLLYSYKTNWQTLLLSKKIK